MGGFEAKIKAITDGELVLVLLIFFVLAGGIERAVPELLSPFAILSAWVVMSFRPLF